MTTQQPAASETSGTRKLPWPTDNGKRPKWTVLYNIVSKESDAWVGTGWEFFDDERAAELCYRRQIAAGNVPCRRPFFCERDDPHLGAGHFIRATPPPAAPPAELPEWSQQPPTEQDIYWHWNGDEDSAPVPLSVFWSGFSQKCFVSRGQYGIDEAIDCDKYGGWWLRLPGPLTPPEIEREKVRSKLTAPADAELAAEVERLRAQLALEACDWAEIDDALDAVPGIVVDLDGYRVPTMDKLRLVIEQLRDRDAELEKLRKALEVAIAKAAPATTPKGPTP